MSTYQIGDYYVLKVKFPHDTSSGSHSLYCKPHKDHSDKQELPHGRTLFVAGLPFYVNRDSITNMFASFGPISSLYLSNSPGVSKVLTAKPKNDPYMDVILPDIDNYLYAYVVFSNEITFESIKKLCKKTRDNPLKCNQVRQVGITSWIEEYRKERPDIEKLEGQVKSFMTKFDARRQQEDNKVKKRKNIPDEDGWITVTGKNNRKIPKTKLSKVKLKRVSRKKKMNELLHFYKFQMREEKRDGIIQLQKKFDEDKKKVAAMKLNRKFKPL